MANQKKQYPKNLYGIIREENGYSFCKYVLNDEKRIKLVEMDAPEVLYLVLGKLKLKAYFDLEKEKNEENR